MITFYWLHSSPISPLEIKMTLIPQPLAPCAWEHRADSGRESSQNRSSWALENHDGFWKVGITGNLSCLNWGFKNVWKLTNYCFSHPYPTQEARVIFPGNEQTGRRKLTQSWADRQRVAGRSSEMTHYVGIIKELEADTKSSVLRSKIQTKILDFLFSYHQNRILWYYWNGMIWLKVLWS